MVEKGLMYAAQDRIRWLNYLADLVTPGHNRPRTGKKISYLAIKEKKNNFGIKEPPGELTFSAFPGGTSARTTFPAKRGRKYGDKSGWQSPNEASLTPAIGLLARPFLHFPTLAEASGESRAAFALHGSTGHEPAGD